MYSSKIVYSFVLLSALVFAAPQNAVAETTSTSTTTDTQESSFNVADVEPGTPSAMPKEAGTTPVKKHMHKHKMYKKEMHHKKMMKKEHKEKMMKKQDMKKEGMMKKDDMKKEDMMKKDDKMKEESETPAE
jgi:hypothetical protein